MKQIIFSLIVLLHYYEAEAQQQDPKQRQALYLEQITQLQRNVRDNAPPVTFQDGSWTAWQRRTGEMPPDFAALPSIPFLPNPLLLDQGTNNIPITTLDQWNKKKDWIKKGIQHWLTGRFPEQPLNLIAEILEEQEDADGVLQKMIALKFGPDHQAQLTVELLIPPGEGPFPVFMTQWNHRGWAEIALRRGYIGLRYAGADSKDDTENYAQLYPDFDFTTLMRRAWGAMRAVDYLYTLPEVDQSKIAIAGHSRNGKQALMAAAFDDRITAVIPSSGGTAGENSFRFTDDRYDNESLDEISANFPHWLHPRLRFFHGREHKLPVDQNLLMSLIAPRALLLSSAITEEQGSPWGIEQNYHSLLTVYNFLGEREKLAIRLRQGRHGTLARDIEAFMDFLDYVYGRGVIKPENELFYNYTFDGWKKLSKENVDPLDFPVREYANPQDIDENQIKEQLKWVLGVEPPGAKAAGPFGIARQALSDDFLGDVIQREHISVGKKIIIGPYNALADYQYAYLHLPDLGEASPSDAKIPVVLFIHEFSYGTGFGRRSGEIITRYLKAGFAVLTMDMIGFGSRIEEGTKFYQRYPHWSKMGKMVADVKSAVDALQDFDMLDQSNIFLAGYALGGTVALLSAALDERIAGVAVSAAFTPLRTATEHVEGLQSYSHLHGLIPRLGFFKDHSPRLPVDFPEIISVLAPRPVLIMAPLLDRHADLEEVKKGIGIANQYYERKGSDKITAVYPIEVNRFTSEQQQRMVAWTVQQVRK